MTEIYIKKQLMMSDSVWVENIVQTFDEQMFNTECFVSVSVLNHQFH